jgi:hypothetical protein
MSGSLETPQSLNRFAYVHNDPTNSVDPLGLCEPGSMRLLPGGGVAVCECYGDYCEWDGRLDPISENEPRGSDRQGGCDVTLPSDETKLALVYTLMHEGTPTEKLQNPQPTYKIGDVYGHPTGATINYDLLLQEMLFIIAAISNYARAHHKSVLDAIHDDSYMIDATHKSKYFYNYGKQLADMALRHADSGHNDCTKLKLAVSAVEFELAPGYLPANIQFWKGIRQGNWIRPGTDAYTRVAYTDFIPSP